MSLLTRTGIDGWETRRFRANVVLDGAGEDALVGSEVSLGGARLSVALRIVRSDMVSRPQPDGVEQDSSELRTIAQDRDSCLSLGAAVVEPGPVRVGDALRPAG